MARRPAVRLRSEPPLFDIFSFGRAAPSSLRRFSPGQIAQIARTVHRTPEVMVKVTGGGKSRGAVAAHFAYISRKGELEIETDDGQRAIGRDATKALLGDWHLELISGQYRWNAETAPDARQVKLVHNIVFSMPPPTPPNKVLSAAKQFAQEKFSQHRYAMVLHTDQPNPHVHMVVKAEDEFGRRLHIDKDMLRQWRQDFASAMREQGVDANATPRVIRGKNKGKTPDPIFRAQRRGDSRVLRERATSVAQELARTRTISDPARSKVAETRRNVAATWVRVAEALETQGEIGLGGEVRHFAKTLPRALTDREHLATQLIEHMRTARSHGSQNRERGRDDDLVR